MAQRVLEHLPERTVAFIAQRLRQARHVVVTRPPARPRWRIDSRPASRGLRATQAAARCNSAPSGRGPRSRPSVPGSASLFLHTCTLTVQMYQRARPSGAGETPRRGTRPRAPRPRPPPQARLRNAWSMSAIRSSSCSRPMETRISPSDTPAASRSAAGTPGVRGRGRMADQRFGAAQAHRRLEQAQRVDEAEGLGAAAVQHEGEGRARAAALAPVHVLVGGVGDQFRW